MRRKVCQTLAVMSVLYFASAAPGHAQELPLPQSADDVAAAIQDVVSTAPAVPEAPPSPPTVPAVPTPATDAPEPTPPTPQTATESQYQPPATQYQPPSIDPESTPEAQSSPAADAVPEATQGATIEAPVEAPAATHISPENSAASSLPSTWIWNWNWNCDPSSVPPEQNVIVDGTWSWNWNFNCTTPNASTDSGQYQSAATQYQPQNSNISIRVGSPGDNGAVTQTIAALAQATSTTANTIAQTAAQETGATDTGASTGSTITVPAAAVVQQVVTAVSEAVVAVLPPVLAASPVAAALTPPALPPISALGVIPLPSALPLPPELGTLGGELGLVQPTSNVWQGVETRSRPAPARLPQPAYGVGVASAWDRSLTPVAAAAPRASKGTPARSPRPGQRLPMPAPGGPSVAGASASSAAGVAAAAFAALLASYFFFPPFGAWRAPSPRDRRRLRPSASRLERPG